MSDDPLSAFRDGVVLEFRTRRESRDFLRLLEEHQPSHSFLQGASLFSEALDAESLLNVDSRNLIIRDVEKRQAAAVVSNRDLLTATEEGRLHLPGQQASGLMVQMQKQLQPRPPAPPWVADPDRNPMWHESASMPFHGCVASRTFVRGTAEGSLYAVQDRLTAIVGIPGLRVAVFAALVWERITATN